MITTPASDLERFFSYTRAFELAFLGDGWADLGPFFAADARHVARDAGPFGEGEDVGRDAVVAGLARSVRQIDRRFDVRIPEVIAGPVPRADGVWMRYALTLRRAGIPDLRVEGEHLTRYAGGLIQAIEERLVPGTGTRVAAYLAEHGARLRPPGAPPSFDLDPRDARELDACLARTLVRCYGGAKSVQDVGATLALCSDAFLLETPSLGALARGREQARAQLELFFAVFPDYAVAVEGLAAEGGSVACWGRARMTFAAPFLGIAATGRTADLPFVSIFGCTDGMVSGERFLFDLATLCAEIGVPFETMRDALGGPHAARLEEARAAVGG